MKLLIIVNSCQSIFTSATTSFWLIQPLHIYNIRNQVATDPRARAAKSPSLQPSNEQIKADTKSKIIGMAKNSTTALRWLPLLNSKVALRPIRSGVGEGHATSKVWGLVHSEANAQAPHCSWSAPMRTVTERGLVATMMPVCVILFPMWCC